MFITTNVDNITFWLSLAKNKSCIESPFELYILYMSMEYLGVDWQHFGLRKNPFNTRPLLEGGEASIEKLFVGRDVERSIIDRIFASADRACVTICGRVGVGKTSLSNYEKHVWKQQRPKLLFSSRRELEASKANLTKDKFILGIIASVIREIELVDPELLKREARLDKLRNLIDVVVTVERSASLDVGAQGFSFGVGGSKSQSINQPLQIPDVTLEAHLADLVDVIKSVEIGGKKYSGLIVHMNNFDVVLRQEDGVQKCKEFFDEIRDILQHLDIYYLFLGPDEFFREVLSSPRVKAVFSQTPIVLRPLSKAELIQALDVRLEEYKSTDVVKPVRPVTVEVISRFYDLYEGDIRSILSALDDTLKQGGPQITSPLSVDEAIALLARDRLTRIEDILTPETKNVLWTLMQDAPVRQADLAVKLGKPASNISKYLAPLKDRGVVSIVDEEGTSKFLDLSPEYACLRYFIEAEVGLKKHAEAVVGQLNLGV